MVPADSDLQRQGTKRHPTAGRPGSSMPDGAAGRLIRTSVGARGGEVQGTLRLRESDKRGDVRRSARNEVAAGDDQFVSTGEAAARLGVASVNTVKRWMRLGLLSGRRVGGRYKVAVSSINSLLQQGSKDLANEQARYAQLKKWHDKDDLGDIDPS